MTEFLDSVWDFLVRWRTWAIGVAAIAAQALPDLIGIVGYLASAPEIGAVLPPEYRMWAGFVSVICLVWSRPRPAVRGDDLEASVSRSRTKR